MILELNIFDGKFYVVVFVNVVFFFYQML